MSSLSPGIITNEVDLTYATVSQESNNTGYVGLFRWGPVEEIIEISSDESELQTKVFSPDTVTAVHYLSCANYLLYSTPLYISRAISAGAVNAVASGSTAKLVKNEDEYELGTHTGISFIAKYPGELGNNLLVSVADSTAFSTWDYADQFDYAPAAGLFHVVVIDNGGIISGSSGTVLETFDSLSTVVGSKKINGTTAYAIEAIKNQSDWIYIGDLDAIDFEDETTPGIYETELEGGVDDNDEDSADYQSALEVFEDTETVDVIRVFSANCNATIQGYVVDLCDTRQDAVAFTAPTLDTVFKNSSATADVIEYYNETLNKNTSYGVACDNWKLVYNKYNDTNVWIPCNSDVAGLHSRIFVTGRPWYSPAGLNNGQLKNVIRLAWSPKKTQRDQLWKNHINSIVAMPGEGTVLWGDRTMYKASSAFNKINVRTLFIIMKKTVSKSAKYLLFEINDSLTQLLFRNSTSSYLGTVQSERGIYEYRVICDETNNTAAVLDADEFVGTVLVKPARTINTIRLNFVAVGNTVDFSEIEGD